MARTTKAAAPARLLTVPAPGGGTIQMRQFTSRQFVAMRRGEMDEIALMEMTVAAIDKYLPGQDPWDLPPDVLLNLTAAWISAKLDDVLPPETA